MLSLEIFHDHSITYQSEGSIMDENKPSINEVVEYTKKMVRYFIFSKAKSMPYEMKDEIEQIAYVKILEKYPEIKGEGWKSLVFQKCRGIVLDYIKLGTGFEDDDRMSRISLVDRDGEEESIDQAIGSRGIFDQMNLERIDIKWDLVARLASTDLPLRAFAKQLLGIPLKQIGPSMDVEIARADQLVKEFINRFDDPHYADDTTGDGAWFRQCCYALGITHLMGWPNEPIKLNDCNNYIGFHLDKVDLYSTEPSHNYKLRIAQTSFDFDGE